MRKYQVLPPPGGTYPPGAADPKGDAGVDAGWLLLQGMVLGWLLEHHATECLLAHLFIHTL